MDLDPGTWPTLARVRLDTPSLRGNFINEIFSLKGSIRSTDHLTEVEDFYPRRDEGPAKTFSLRGTKDSPP